MHDLEQSIIRILDVQGRTVGTGFVVADHLAVTCTHVVQAAGSTLDHSIRIQFYRDTSEKTASVLQESLSPATADDVAFLQFDHIPEGVVPVVLGSARHSEGHRYTVFGFARLAGYENRRVVDIIEGVVSVADKRKQRMLQLKGEEIDKGLSGSPVLDLDTDRVMGMISEYKDSERARFAWATLSDTFVSLHPALQLWPQAYGPKELDLYLSYLIETHQYLELPVGPPHGKRVPLERVYVSLRTNEMSVTEWKAEHKLYLEDLAMVQREIKRALVADQYTEWDLIRKAIIRHPKVLKLTARDWTRLFSLPKPASLSLAEVVQRHPQVVILGDPGSGKTTLGRWLVLQFARAMQQRMPHVHVDAGIVSLSAQQDTPLDLGPARMPVFLRIADYARAHWEKDQGGRRLSLEGFLGEHENKRDLPPDLTPEAISAIIQAYLTQGKALVVLDGLDEVADPGQRKAVMQEVKRLLRSASPETPLANDVWTSNCVVLTSRIIGYQFDPLTDLPHYTVEGMDRKAIIAFCHAWMHHIAAISDTETAEQANKLIDAIFDHAHPGVRVLASNPLLLTIMAHIYWNSTQRTLPTRRVDLFEEAIRTLYNQRKAFWGQAGISEKKLMRALGAVAAYIQANEVTGFVVESEVRKLLGTLFSDPEQVDAVLRAARDVSGFFSRMASLS